MNKINGLDAFFPIEEGPLIPTSLTSYPCVFRCEEKSSRNCIHYACVCICEYVSVCAGLANGDER